MISAKKDLVSAVRMLSKGASDFIKKPVDWPNLQETLLRHLRSRRNAAAPQIPAASTVRAAAGKVLPTVLVVEDSSTQRALWRLTLGEHEARATMVGNGREALRAIETDGLAFRVLVTDIELGDITGWVVAEAARKANAMLPIVVISSTVETGSRPLNELPGDSASVYCFHKSDRSMALQLVRRLLDLPAEPARQQTTGAVV
jgi:DNA-binding NtrC family response regulator